MTDATCKTCPSCELGVTAYRPSRKPGDPTGQDGLCRNRAPLPYPGNDTDSWALWPVVNPAKDWCGEHPDRQHPHADELLPMLGRIIDEAEIDDRGSHVSTTILFEAKELLARMERS